MYHVRHGPDPNHEGSRPVASIVTSRCTCSPFSSGEETCNHINFVASNQIFIERVHSILTDENEVGSFGGPVSMEMTWPTVILPHRNTEENEQSSFAVRRRVHNLLKRWSLWIVFDMQLCLFVCLIKPPKLRFTCHMCRCRKQAFCEYECLAKEEATRIGVYDYVDYGDGDEMHQEPAGEKDDRPNTTTSFGSSNTETWAICPMHNTRPVLSCTGEQKTTEKLYDRISAANGATIFFEMTCFIVGLKGAATT